MAFDRYGKADLYLNSIIGYVHRWYDGGKLSELFGAFQGTALQDIYDTIFWLGLECGAYEKEREGRLITGLLVNKDRDDYYTKYKRIIDALNTDRTEGK